MIFCFFSGWIFTTPLSSCQFTKTLLIKSMQEQQRISPHASKRVAPVISPDKFPVKPKMPASLNLSPNSSKSRSRGTSTNLPSCGSPVSIIRSRASSPASPSRAQSPSRPMSPTAYMSRYGIKNSPEPTFGVGERFHGDGSDKWDLVYEQSGSLKSNGTKFSKSKQIGDINVPASINVGPYDVAPGYNALSEFRVSRSSKFLTDTRKGLDLCTPSPGSIYDTVGVYSRGSDKKIKISFNCDKRLPLHYNTPTTNVEFSNPALPQGISKSFGKKLAPKKPTVVTPGAIYDVHRVKTFKTGPSFSFGGNSRF